jgi:non-specific serine/threonine protein kinase
MRPTHHSPEPSQGIPHRRSWQETLRALREARGITQEGWAARLGVSRKTVQRWEGGERAPDPGAEAGILNYCREAGLFRTFDRGPLAGMSLTEEGLRELFGEARWHRGVQTEKTPPPAEPGAGVVGAQPTNLPAHLTSFVGRQTELAEVRRIQAGTRLLTLTGTGGCGKTRLALALADELLWGYPHGVWFVNLAPVTDPALVPKVIASALMMHTAGQQPLLEVLITELSARHLLIVLDNCEHLLPACAALVETLLRACHHLEVLATSREPLGIAGETIWRVPPMRVPNGVPCDSGGGSATAELEPADSVQLFMQRARLQRPEFAVTPYDAFAVAEICRRLDGMPLAIELAAALVKALSVGQIAERLHDRFRLLTSGSRTALPRQQTLRAALDWSHDLLTAAEQVMLRSLSVFVSSFPLEAAEALHVDACDERRRATVTREDVLDLLMRLVDKSLVIAEEQGGVVRYRMLETVRRYGVEKLRAAGELITMQQRHAAWCLALAEAAEAAMFGPHEPAWLTRLEQELDSLRAAMAWTVAEGGWQGEAALRLAVAPLRFWELRGYLDEGRRWLAQALALAADTPAVARTKALSGAGILAYMQGEFAEAKRLFEQSLAGYREVGDWHGVAQAQGNLGRTLLRQGDDRAAQAHLKASLALYANHGYELGMANVQFSLGVVSLRKGDYHAAEARFRASLALNRRLGNREGIANALEELATVFDEQGQAAGQDSLLTESLRLYRELGDRSGIASVLGDLGMEAWVQGEPERAMSLLQEGLTLYREVGDRRGIARLLGNQSFVAVQRSDYERATTLCRESIALYHESGDAWAVARYLPVLAAASFGQGQPQLAARLFGAAAALRDRLGATLPPFVRANHDRTVAAVGAALGEKSFAVAWAEGRAMPPETAIAW